MEAVGIDVGGTYTDGVLFDLRSKSIVRKVKVPTRSEDLRSSILKCFSALNVRSPALLSRFCLSTTLATNAVVEGTKRDVCAICIGMRPRHPAEYAAEMIMVDGRIGPTGLVEVPLDEVTLQKGLERSERRSFAISSFFSTRNPQNEVRAAEMVLEELPKATVVKGSDLVGILGMEERMYIAVKNAELIHIMAGLLEAIGEETKVPGSVTYVLKGDGTLVSTEEAALRPIFTVLSGPAASALGGAFLAGVDDALVVDIGGTTTDIALVQGGMLKLSEDGAVVGGSRLRVESADMTTRALGGNTEIVCRDGRPQLGQRAVVPLCLSSDPWKLMSDRSYLYPQAGKEHGITPTDLFCATGRSDFGDRKVATSAMTALAEECGLTLSALLEILEDAIRARLLRTIAEALLNRQMPERGEGEAILRGNGMLRTVMRIGVPLVGIGAPVAAFLDLIREHIDGPIIVPRDHEVGNALGAICTEVHGRKEVIVRNEPRWIDGKEVPHYHVAVAGGLKVFTDREEAIGYALEHATRALREYMERSRVRRFQVLSEVRDVAYMEMGRSRHVETIVSVSAGGI